MGDCHLNFNPPLCKFNYASWCPTCEKNSPRRRSKSETANECRRKCREMKTFSPRKHAKSHEYENMDLEYEVNPKEFNRHIRSSQLCELPTSYISNNCQKSKMLPTSDDYSLAVEKNHVKSLDKMKQEEFFDVLKYEKAKHATGFPRKLPKEPPRPLFYDTHHLSFDTGTYFDKIRDTAGLHERYTKEIESVREKIAAWRSSNQQKQESKAHMPLNFSDHTPLGHQNRYFRECDSLRERLKNGSQRIEPVAVNPKPNLEIRKNTPQNDAPKPNKIVSLKTRVKSGSCSAKKRKVKIPVKKSNAVSNFSESGSDESEGEEIKSEDESECLSENSCSNAQNNHAESLLPQPGGGDTLGWPVRASLFPHIPPYIRFTPHDAEAPVVVPAGRKLFKWKLSTITPILVRKTLSNSGFALIRSEFSRESNQWLGTWGRHMKSPMFKTLKDTQKLNHFPGTFQLGRKDRLWRNFQRLINKYGYKEFGFIPQTFVLPQELKILKQNWEYKNGSGGETWIIKPPASARGVGIKVINKWSQLPKKQSLVVQKYISNPYLINGSKFDLRLYVLVTSFNPLRIYLYPEGLARFASVKYSDDAKDLKDRYMHLTNYSINKFSSQYTANEDANACQGHKWTLTKLFEYMEKQGVDTKALWRNLQQLVIKTIITGETPIYQLCEDNMLSRYNCYELFGVDVLLDENLKPWLLEVNISPSLHSASPLDAHVKGPLVQMLFDLAQFHFPPRLAQIVKQSPDCYEPKIYTTTLTKKEREKQNLFVQYECRQDYLDDILENLTGDDVRKLALAEDEFTVKGKFERIFPTSQTHKYLNFMQARYYNRLFDAWETRFEKNRQAGIGILRALCAEKVHLKVAPPTTLDKNSPNTTLGAANLQPSKEGQSLPIPETKQENTIANNPSCNN